MIGLEDSVERREREGAVEEATAGGGNVSGYYCLKLLL